MTTVERLGAEKYVLLTTFRKDGRAVPTPVWVVPDGDGFAVWTPTESGKVKRIRNSGRVTVAACDMRGRPTGEAIEAVARVGDAADTARIRRTLGRKYGVPARLMVWGSKIRRGEAGTVAVLVSAA
ncbi:MAG TPA: PPOX class F420-dependent oxidoreductase [Actinoplanes sp.]|nr:PPOX class F420-dependent oxidoreductase [Actinoplanes sp.]